MKILSGCVFGNGITRTCSSELTKMKLLFLFSFVAVTMLHCTAKKNETTDTVGEDKNTVSETAPAILEKGCYGYHANNSSIEFEITETGETVAGNLMYALAEKDKNTGTFEGHLKDDKLLGVYTFHSEGSESAREVAFLVKGNQLIEGYGEVEVEGNKATFKDRNALNYSSAMPLTQSDCDP
jgi:hypothetical protein